MLLKRFVFLLIIFLSYAPKTICLKDTKRKSIPTQLGIVANIYECNPYLSPALLTNVASNPPPIQIKPAVTLLIDGCADCSGTLNINGDLSVTNSKNVAITVTSLSDITVNGSVRIIIPEDGTFTINSISYNTSPIDFLYIVKRPSSGVKISCNDYTPEEIFGVYIDQDIVLNIQGDLDFSNNTVTGVTETNDIAIHNLSQINCSGDITIKNNSSSNTVAGRVIQETDGSITIVPSINAFLNNTNASINCAGTITIENNQTNGYGPTAIRNDGTISSRQSLNINNNSTTSNFYAWGIYNDGEMNSDQINITNNSSSGVVYSAAVYNIKAINTESDITIQSNSATSIYRMRGFINNGNIASSQGDILIDSNKGFVFSSQRGTSFGFWNTANNSLATITATFGSLTITNNESISADSTYCYSSYGAYNGTQCQLVANGQITLSNNSGKSGDNDNCGFFNDSDAIVASNSNILMNHNEARTGIGKGAYSIGAISQNGLCTISLNTTTNQEFYSYQIPINNNTSKTPLPFSSFAITIDASQYGNSGGTYSDMQTAHPGILILNPANQI